MSAKTKTKRKKLNLRKNTYTRKQKTRISEQVYDITDEEVEKSYKDLVELGCQYHKVLGHTGNKVVNKYTATERLNTVGVKGYSFYDVWFNKNKIKKEKFAKSLMKFYKNTNPNYPYIKVMYRLSNIYFSAVSIFKPLIAMDVYCKYQPKCVLDMTMGWGGRLVGACALNIPKYIGIDYNQNLKTPYAKLSRFLKKHSTTEIDLYFQDALSIDYSKFNYDLVLTSPPYYNIETYGGNKTKSKQDWDTNFYIPLFEKTYKHLANGGHYCVNIPEEVYENVALKVLGKPTEKIALAKSKRSPNDVYKEYIYVWKKSTF
jgi:hypothetical protein